MNKYTAKLIALALIGAVLASPRVVVVKEEASDESIEELVVLDHYLLVRVGNGDGGDAAEVRQHT